MERMTLENLMKLGKYAEKKSALVASTLADLERTYADAVAAVNAVEADQTRTNAAKAVTRSEVAQKAKNRVKDKIEATAQDLTSKLAAAELSVLSAYAEASPAQEIRLASVRQALAAMKGEDRDIFVRTALIENDITVIRAIATAPRFVSGANPLAHGDARALLEERHNPEAFAQRQSMRDGMVALDDAARNFDSMLSDLVDHKAVEAVQEAKTRAVEALAKLEKDVS